MEKVIRPEVYQRIVLAKSLHRDAVAACAIRNDHMAFAKGILLLHDAAEALLGAVALMDHRELEARWNERCDGVADLRDL